MLERFKVSLFTEGSGTQIYSTTFVQWAAREILRRAKPLTLVARYSPRVREASMNELLSGTAQRETDPAGSLVDADMGAWYTWISLQRLTGADQSAFVAWFEGHEQAVAIGPSFPKGTEESSAVTLTDISQQDRNGTLGLIKRRDRSVSAISGCSNWNPAFSVAAGITRKLVNRKFGHFSPRLDAWRISARAALRVGAACDRVQR